MKAKRFSSPVLAALAKDMILGVRAGRAPHRFVGVWAVVVEGRVFVRSYSLKPRSWYRTFREEPQGTIQLLSGREIRVRARRTASERLRDAVDEAYARKYPTPGSLKYVRGFRTARRRETTTELIPA